VRARDAAIVVVLAVLSLLTVAVAAAVKSAIPLFGAWIPQLLIVVYLSRVDRAAAAATAPVVTPAAIEPPDGEARDG
jgi:hypothetical protein